MIMNYLNFVKNYNLALLDATSKAFETFVGCKKEQAQSIEKTIGIPFFNTTLQDDLNDDTLASSMADYIDSSLKYKMFLDIIKSLLISMIFLMLVGCLNRFEDKRLIEHHLRSLR